MKTNQEAATQQEQMQYTYDKTGIEPKYINNKYGELLVPNKKISEYDLLEGSYAYFPAEQLWDLLPHTIGDYCLIESKDLPGIVSTGYYKQDGNSFCSSDNLEIKMGESSLDTRLDMVCWCIDQGYIASRACEAKGKDDE